MPRIEFYGVDEDTFDFDLTLEQLSEIPEDVKLDAVGEMATFAGTKVKEAGAALGVRDPDSQVHILDKITHTKPKYDELGAAYYSYVTFFGTRTRGRTKTRNAEIAFINEYGKRGQAPRPFIRNTVEQYGKEIYDYGEKRVLAWIDKTIKN